MATCRTQRLLALGPAPEVAAVGEHERLHVLTHPEWWQAEAMSPRRRIMRCIEGRAAPEENYDALLADNQRVNVGLTDPPR